VALPGMARVASTAGPGASSTFMSLGGTLRLSRAAGSPAWSLSARLGREIRLDAILRGDREPVSLCAVAAVPGGGVNCTHKTVGLPVEGTILVHGRSLSLDGSFAVLDHTSGLLPRRTEWRWASASGEGIGLNLVQGFNGEKENAVWLEGQLIKVGEATIEYPKGERLPWRVRTSDGVVDLEFVPEGARRADTNLLVAKSFYVQPVGTFRGTLRPEGRKVFTVERLVGVTEHHVAVW